MKYLSICSGIEAATCAWHPLGWEPFSFAEIEKFPSKVLAHHYPSVPNLGDMTKFEEWPDATIDLLVGGTPCQSFSVAGLRKGLADPRGNLMLTYGAIARRYWPKWLVWENVPGVLSSNGGRDFGTFLGMLGQLGYGFAYRVLDAQYFGVAQRRRRVFVVGCLGDWRGAAAVLFERHSLQGNPAPSREAGKETSGTISSRTSGGGGLGTDFECSGGLQPVAETLRAGGNKSGGDRPPGTDVDTAGTYLIPVPHADISPAIKARDSKGVSSDGDGDGDGDGAILVPMRSVLPFDTTQITSASNYSNPQAGDPCHPLAAGAHIPGIAFPGRMSGTQCASSEEVSPAICSVNPTAVSLSESLYNKGFTQGGKHASPQEAHARTLLRELQETIGEETFAKWGLGILDSLQSSEVLQQTLHGSGVRPAAFSRSWVVNCALSRQEDCSGWLLQSLREAGCQRCTSQGWKPSEQLARELGAYLSELSQPGAQAVRFMRDLWWSAQGAGVLRKALSAIQEVGRPANNKEKPAYRATQVRRLTPTECEFLQGFPRGYTLIPGNKADGPRYKALGNSMAVPVMAWIGKRIQMVDEIQISNKAAA